MQVRPYHIRSQQDWDRLFNFAESFGHAIDQRFGYVALVNQQRQWVGYAGFISVPAPGTPGAPVAITAWHPEMSPRDLVRGMQALTNWALMAHGKAVVMVPDGSPLTEHMDALGYDFWTPNHRMYLTKPLDM